MKRYIIMITIAFLLTGIAIKLYADHRTKDFFIENYFLKEKVYDTKEKAESNVEVKNTDWKFSGYCVDMSAKVEEGLVTTTLSLKVPTWKYLLNLNSAKEEIIMVGEC